MRIRLAMVLGLLLTGVIVAAPFGYRSVESVRYRNFRVVKEGELYRSGQMTTSGLARVTREFHIGTVISFRDRKDETGVNDDLSESELCAQNGIAFHRIAPADWSPVNGVIPGDETVKEFLRILDDPKTRKPVLVHCFAGIHRTGAHCAVYRMEYDGWSADDAITEMLSMGTPRTTFAPNLLEYLSKYQRNQLREGK